MHPKKQINFNRRKYILLGVLAFALLVGLTAYGELALAKPSEKPARQPSPLHPTFPLLDANGENVLDTNEPVSTMATCGSCHNTEFIEEHSFHSSAGLNEFTEPEQGINAREWDSSPGYFGRWNPLLYRYLSPNQDSTLDLGTAAWIQLFGSRHTGGGPAVYSRNGESLLDLAYTPGDPETNILDPTTGEAIPWDWKASGVVEMNCFLCHTPRPNNDARITALESGDFKWASTATLLGTGIVSQSGDTWQWNPEAFQTNGELKPTQINVQDPTNENCGVCHGLVHDNLAEPLVAAGCAPERWRTETTGQIVSPQRLSDTGMNLADKESLTRSWDVHAERMVSCTDCHFSLNNPIYYRENDTTQPDHLVFDPRRLDLGEYLYQPSHQFARGTLSQGTIASELKDSMRRCDSCHETDNSHTFLPYTDRHMTTLSCETCHIPKLYSTALQQYDWTVINTDSAPETACRGIKGPSGTLASLITGFEPVLLQTEDTNGNQALAPFNLITSWFWVYGDPARPVRLLDLEAAWLDGTEYHSDILAVFDKDQNGNLDENEIVIDSSEKETLIANRLSNLGLTNPRIVGEIQPYSINHDVANGDWAIRDCETCHSETSRLTATFKLASYIPGGVLPELVPDARTELNGNFTITDDGALYYDPSVEADGLYILGSNEVTWIDTFGLVMFIGTLLGIFTHGGLRFYAVLRMPHYNSTLKKVYMYSVYERLWHWLQTAAILLLLFTGLIIHKPETFGLFSFRGVVMVHNVLAVLLVINAALSLFYHLVSGEIKQYIPRPRGFFDQAITQALFYLRDIFKKDEHPFEKTPEKKLNPLQQVTYFGILNVLLPLQIITGALMWGVQRWPEMAASLGGLPFLAPFHTLIAWLFASFIVGHVYLTTTGHTPLAGIKSMIMGWDELEIHSQPQEEATA